MFFVKSSRHVIKSQKAFCGMTTTNNLEPLNIFLFMEKQYYNQSYNFNELWNLLIHKIQTYLCTCPRYSATVDWGNSIDKIVLPCGDDFRLMRIFDCHEEGG